MNKWENDQITEQKRNRIECYKLFSYREVELTSWYQNKCDAHCYSFFFSFFLWPTHRVHNVFHLIWCRWHPFFGTFLKKNFDGISRIKQKATEIGSAVWMRIIIEEYSYDFSSNEIESSILERNMPKFQSYSPLDQPIKANKLSFVFTSLDWRRNHLNWTDIHTLNM